ncbi:hypothetical protein B1R38_05070 [Bacillus cereus]|nr:hypothetical protein B1R38_05070 [Bacillus cereus]
MPHQMQWGEYSKGSNRNEYNGCITAVSKTQGSVEIWWINSDGSVHGAYWQEGGQWHQYELAPANSASTSGGITAVSRIPSSVEVWWIGDDSSIQGAYWYEGGQWHRYELAPANSASSQGNITAVSKTPNSLDLWWTGAYRSLEGAYWNEGGQWGRYQLAPAEYVQGSITAVSRKPGSLAVFWVGAAGTRIDGAFWNGGGQWERYSLPTLLRHQEASLKGDITAVSRIPGSVEIWWISKYGSVIGASWYEGAWPESGLQGWNLYQLASEGSTSIYGNITAVSRIPSSMEVWWIGGTNSPGSIEDAYWYEGRQWERYQLVSEFSASSFESDITAVSRKQNTMELFWLFENTIKGAFWQEGVGWNRFELMR